jgi:hypothetical protein
MSMRESEPGFDPSKMAPAAAAEYQAFLSDYAALQRDLASTPLRILVWGPGEQAGATYRKRTEIIQQLNDLGHATFTSERVDQDHPMDDYDPLVRERLQAYLADLIVVFMASYGSLAEAFDMSDDFGNKMLIYVSDRHHEGYPFRGRLTQLRTKHNNVFTFQDPADLEKCNLLGQCMDHIRLAQATKFYSSKLCGH